MWALWGAIMGGANIVLHAAGWMEGGLHASPEKLVIDADLLHMVAAHLAPLDLSPDALAVEAIAEVGPGGHFFGSPHTQERYQRAFHSPLVSDWRNWETWSEAGCPDAYERASGLVDRFLEAYAEPAIDEARREELRAFVDRRVAEGGVPTDY
jgi:trimethylamine--corrinoid protein Co-methyltransferase